MFPGMRYPVETQLICLENIFRSIIFGIREKVSETNFRYKLWERSIRRMHLADIVVLISKYGVVVEKY